MAAFQAALRGAVGGQQAALEQAKAATRSADEEMGHRVNGVSAELVIICPVSTLQSFPRPRKGCQPRSQCAPGGLRALACAPHCVMYHHYDLRLNFSELRYKTTFSSF